MAGVAIQRQGFDHAVPLVFCSSFTRRQLALPSSRVPPLSACPALRPRWCPVYLPYRIRDCCLPSRQNRRLSLRSIVTARCTILSSNTGFLIGRFQQEVIPLSTTIHISGLYHAACTLAPPGSVSPITGMHAGFATDLLARL